MAETNNDELLKEIGTLKKDYQELLQSVNLITDKILMIDEKFNQQDEFDKGLDYFIYKNKIKINEIIRYLKGVTDKVPEIIS